MLKRERIKYNVILFKQKYYQCLIVWIAKMEVAISILCKREIIIYLFGESNCRPPSFGLVSFFSSTYIMFVLAIAEAPGRGVSALNKWGDLAVWRDELRGTRGGAVGHSHGGGWGSSLLSRGTV